MPNIGPMEIAIVVIVALVILGPKKLPEWGRGMGKGLREFKQSVTGQDEAGELPPGEAPKAEEAEEAGAPATKVAVSAEGRSE